MKNKNFGMLREKKQMSQVQVAKELGISKDYVNMLENNRRTPGFGLAKRIADLFDTTIEEIFF
ncbi:MAG: helix-turn-helix transcriptional regulator [Clostridium sp.]